MGDRGCAGPGVITPRRRPPGRPLPKADKDWNRPISTTRCKTERTIANLKTWRALHTDYRRPINIFEETLTAILGITFTYTL
ncbi:hypothetical protein OHJ16_03785 [Actinomyces israelii]|uniref:DDE Tnp4 domain-containing protein n=1 Tax=Actinomyces israelii TaxID=1659 RepID=A0ABT4I625_9ACTO|nr:transposase family protein [Actinomyces israelii]MCZ0857165.1 hypothetical protein [Actinomyces israelii]